MTTYDLGRVVGENGQDGDDGNGIVSIEKTGTSGLVDTYTITYSDGDTDTFTVTNGSDATVTIVSSWSATTSDSKVASEKLTKDSLDDKVSKSSTSGLLKNDGTVDTTSYSTFSGSYNDLSNKPTIPSASSTTPSADTTSGSYGSGTSYARSNHSHPKSSLYAEATHSHTKSQITDFPSLSTVATSGSYADLSNKPSIPSSSSDLSDGSDLVKKSSTTGLIKNDGSIDTNSYLTTSSASSTYQTKLVSGTSIKTINNESLLGSGNITIQGGSSVDIVTAWESTPSDSKVASEKLTKDTLDTKIAKSSTSGLVKNDGTIDTSAYITSSAISGKEDTSNKVSSWSSTTNDTHYPTEKLVKDSLDSKQATLVSGTNIKTINNESLLGSGNLVIQGGGGSGGSCVTDFYIDSNTDEWVIETTACSQGEVVTSWEQTLSDEKVPSEKLVKNYIDGLVGNAILYINGSGS